RIFRTRRGTRRRQPSSRCRLRSSVAAYRTLLHGSAAVAGQGSIGAGWNPVTTGNPAVPFKHHAEHRHHIPKPRYRVTNGSEFDAALRRRGSLTVWFTDAAIAAWRGGPPPTPGGQPPYFAPARTTELTTR